MHFHIHVHNCSHDSYQSPYSFEHHSYSRLHKKKCTMCLPSCADTKICTPPFPENVQGHAVAHTKNHHQDPVRWHQVRGSVVDPKLSPLLLLFSLLQAYTRTFQPLPRTNAQTITLLDAIESHTSTHKTKIAQSKNQQSKTESTNHPRKMHAQFRVHRRPWRHVAERLGCTGVPRVNFCSVVVEKYKCLKLTPKSASREGQASLCCYRYIGIHYLSNICIQVHPYLPLMKNDPKLRR